jgi:hypothetical protein
VLRSTGAGRPSPIPRRSPIIDTIAGGTLVIATRESRRWSPTRPLWWQIRLEGASSLLIPRVPSYIRFQHDPADGRHCRCRRFRQVSFAPSLAAESISVKTYTERRPTLVW